MHKVLQHMQTTKALQHATVSAVQHIAFVHQCQCTKCVQHMQSTISTASNKKRKKSPVRAHFEQDSTAKRRRLNPSRARAYTFLRNGIFVYPKISFGGIPNSRNVLFLQIFLKRAGKPSAGNTSARFPCAKWTWPGLASATFSGTRWTWLGFAPTWNLLLNLTWLCTKASQTFSGTSSGTFFGTLLNLTWLCTKASQTFSGTFSWPCLLRNPVEPDLALHQSLPAFSGTFSGTRWSWIGFAPRLPGMILVNFSISLRNHSLETKDHQRPLSLDMTSRVLQTARVRFHKSLAELHAVHQPKNI